MQAALAGAALLMGLAGGPHCAAMCGAASAAVIRIVPAGSGGAPWPVRAVAPAAFHAGRIAGYAAAGAVAAAGVDALALAGAHVAALKSAWVLLHVAVFGWGAMLAASGRQPLWAQRTGRRLAARLHPPAGTTPAGATAGRLAGALATGALWFAMPCGLLYSALLLAALGNGALAGAGAMALFAAGSGLSLALAPWLWRRLRGRGTWGARLSGVLLAAAALQALWTDLARQVAAWCG